MPESSTTSPRLRVASVIASLTAGGIGPVCRYAAEALARQTDWQVTLLCLHDPPSVSRIEGSGLRIVGLGLDGNCPRLFLDWLKANPQDLVVTSDVSRIEPAFPFVPPSTRHVVQIHDSGRRYRDLAVRNAAYIDGVTCVGKHIEAPLRCSLDAVGFQGLLRTVHNGADFPSPPGRPPHDGPLRLLFMGRLDPLKGVFDFVPILQHLKRLGVPVVLNIVGGENETLRRRFARKGLAEMVRWTGRVPHDQCYAIASESDIFLMTSRKEPFGMVTVEAMSMGCVPIGYDMPSGTTEIIEQGKSGLLVPLADFKGWALAIQGLHQDRQRLDALAAGAIERVRTFFSADVMGANLAAFLRDVMEHAPGHPATRKVGLPPETPSLYQRPRRGYQRLPAGLRDAIRNWVCARPKLAVWVLTR